MSRYTNALCRPGAVSIAMLVLLSTACSEQQSSTPQPMKTSEAPVEKVVEQVATQSASAPEPSATTEPVAATAPSGDASASGESVYQKSCKACHDLGIANAPKLGDSAAWEPRIAKGNDAMLQSVKNGLNAMPPKGACMSCSDEELRSAIEYMIAQDS